MTPPVPQLSVCFSFLRAPVIAAEPPVALAYAPIDFFVLGFIVIGGAWGLPFCSLIEELDVAASTALIYYYVKYLL